MARLTAEPATAILCLAVRFEDGSIGFPDFALSIDTEAHSSPGDRFMADVFISYKREDRLVAQRLAGALQQLGFDVWWDFELLSGENFRRAIRAVIDQCKATVVIWSRLSVESGFVLDESSYALRRGRLCPTRIDAVELPFGFGQLQVDDLSDWDGELSHAGFQSLVKAVERCVGRRARLGAEARPAERQTMTAELEAFKAAQIAGTAGALRNFVAKFPGSVFAGFVRDQIETMEAERATASRAAGTQATAGSAAEPAIPAAGPVSPGWSWKRLAIAGAVAASAVAGLAIYNEANRRDLAQVEAMRAKELEKEAAAERAARARAEQRSEELQRQADQERQGRELAARVDAERKRRDTTYDLGLLHRDVRSAVEAARLEAQRAESVASRARVAAITAETAAERARARVPGTISLSFEGGTYLGEGSGATRNGYGVTMFRAPSIYAGDRFAGQYQDNARNGVGVYYLANNARNVSLVLRREGEYARDKPNGLGVLVWASGDHHAGQWRDGKVWGPGVRTYADGRRYEGGFAADNRAGHGVLWSADRGVLSAGIWKQGRLVTALAP